MTAKFLILSVLLFNFESSAQLWHDSGSDKRSAKEILCSGTTFWTSYLKLNLPSFDIPESKLAYRAVEHDTTVYLNQNCPKIVEGESPEGYASQLEFLSGSEDNCKSHCSTTGLKTDKAVAECRMVCRTDYEINYAYFKGYYTAANSCGQQGKSPASNRPSGDK